jgi:hypothetical protein
MTSCTYDTPRSACSVALETYHSASTIILRILDWLLWIIDTLDLLALIFPEWRSVHLSRKLNKNASSLAQSKL